jgi:hypothetical protein
MASLGALKRVQGLVNGKPQVAVIEIPDGEAGTAATIEVMRRLAVADAHNAEFTKWARAIVRDISSKDYRREGAAIYDFVKRNVKYRLDPRGLEWVQSPYWTLLVDGQGDCDDQSTLLVALCLALGHGCAFITVKVDPERPDDYSHVYAAIGIIEGGRERWIAMDTTQANQSFGWEPPANRILGKKVWVVAQP